MKELDIFDAVCDAYRSSTPRHNYFAEVLSSIDWEDKYFAEDEYYFCYGKLMIVTPSLDPFDEDPLRKPSATFFDNGATINLL